MGCWHCRQQLSLIDTVQCWFPYFFICQMGMLMVAISQSLWEKERSGTLLPSGLARRDQGGLISQLLLVLCLFSIWAISSYFLRPGSADMVISSKPAKDLFLWYCVHLFGCLSHRQALQFLGAGPLWVWVILDARSGLVAHRPLV